MQKLIILKKNVLPVIRYIITIISCLVLHCCSEKKDLVLQNKSKEILFEYPAKVEVLYRGLKVGEAVLVNSQGQYNVFFQDEIRTGCNADYFLIRNSVLGSSFYFNVSEVLSETVERNDDVDTCFYVLKQSYIGKEKIDNVINTFKELLDTLIKQKDNIDTLVFSPK
jgi:hypothetical protein